MLSSLPDPPKNQNRHHQTWGAQWLKDSAKQHYAYALLMGKEPPEPSCHEARVQFEYGYGKYRNKDMKAAILAAASNNATYSFT